MRKFLALFVTCWLVLTPSLKAAEAIIVVANTSDKSLQLNRLQVRNLFMGGALPYDLDAIALPPENQTRVLFNTKVVGLTESRIQSYWAQMRFTGRKKAPREFSNEQSMLEYLINNAGAVGYLPEGISVPNELTVLYTVR
ncbi:conserved hypothetical protein [Paraglaciecola sp. T6c]|uniref:hypothetical protein n=1 Tax=Pseudoalteromonas atlantica (strain T6c / ATCC BAA-1087) TaxID=3042615 RepID=UPI00005C51D2|nr:hypothetical protein [Paraglaciecola sp. T6c]ABG42606.1 conserved hypothetical protein [Paraglaciecola sp. T6c]